MLDRVSADVQHAPYHAEAPVYLGPMTGATWRINPRRLAMALSRYKFCSKMLAGKELVAEIGAGDGFCSEVVRREVGRLVLFDYYAQWASSASQYGEFYQVDITRQPLICVGYPPRGYDGVYALDVLEHIQPQEEDTALRNICKCLTATGVFICGCPSLESQVHASDHSKIGHVNCKSGEALRETMLRHFHNVFMFSMHDEMIGVNFLPMAQYLLAVCVGPK